MSTSRDPDRLLAAWLEEGPADLSAPRRRAIKVAARTTHQARPGLLGRVAWRPMMSRFASLAGAAAVVVAVVGIVLIALPRPPDGSGGTAVASPAPSVAPTPSPTTTRTPTPTPAPSEVAPGITGFTPYTSIYGLTFGVPDGWIQGGRATVKWYKGIDPEGPYGDVFESDVESVAFVVWQQPAGSGADITSRDGLAAWVRANDPDRDLQGAIPLCVGVAACGPAILLPRSGDTIPAYIADPEAGLVTIVVLGHSDDHPATVRYGGGIQLLKSILTTFDVRDPRPGEVPGS